MSLADFFVVIWNGASFGTKHCKRQLSIREVVPGTFSCICAHTDLSSPVPLPWIFGRAMKPLGAHSVAQPETPLHLELGCFGKE